MDSTNIIYGTIGATAGNIINNGNFSSNLSKFQVRYNGTGDWLECSESANITNKSNCSFEIKLKDGETLTNMSFMFYNCLSLTSLNISNFDTSNVTIMQATFRDCTSLTSLNLSNLNTSSLTSMQGIFNGCSSLTSLNLSNLNTSNVTNMSYMFQYCESLTSLDLSNLDTSNVGTMAYMFNGCLSLTSLNLSNLDVSSVTTMYSMFYDCSSLTSLDLSNWNLSLSVLTDYSYILTNTTALRTIKLLHSNENTIKVFFNFFNSIPSQTITAKVTSDNVSYATSIAPNNINITVGNVNNIITGTIGATAGSIINTNFALLSKFQVRYNGTGDWLECSESANITNKSNCSFEIKLKDGETLTSMYDMFGSCPRLVSLDLSNFDTSNVTDMQRCFCECNDLTSLNLSNFNTSKVIDMSYMFNSCSSLTSLNVSSFDTSKVKTMQCMFTNCSRLTSLDLSSFNTSNVDNMYSMFEICKLLTSLDISNFDTTIVSNMRDIFISCDGLTSLNMLSATANTINSFLPYLGTSVARTIYYGQANINDLTKQNNISYVYVHSKINVIAKYKFDSSLYADFIPEFNSEFTDYIVSDIDNGDNTITRTIKHNTLKPTLIRFGNTDISVTNREESLLEIMECDTSQVTNMTNMFNNCNKLTSLDLSNFNTSNVTVMNNMFYNCSSLTSLDLSSFNTSQVTTMQDMFYNCQSLTSLDLSSFDTSKVTTMKYMFQECSSLTSLDLSSFNTSQVTNMSYMFQACSSLISLNLSNFNTSKVTNMTSMFFGCSSLTSLNVSSFDISKVTTMINMFYKCQSLTSLDLSSFNTSQVTNMSYMFQECSSLTSLDLSSFNTSQVTNMSGMFQQCTSLISLNLSNFNTSKVTNMTSMFQQCTSLTSLNLSSFNTSQVTSMFGMFAHCNKLILLDLSSFITSQVTNMGSMFQNCSSLTSLNLSSFNTSQVTNMTNMFFGCISLTLLDISSFDTSKVTTMNTMFYNCQSLTSLDLSSFITSQVTNMQDMFYSCKKLTSLDLSNFDTSKVITMKYMFQACSSLTSLDLSSFNTSQVNNMSYMFDGCSKLTSLDLSNFNTSNVTSMEYIFRNCSLLTSIGLLYATSSTINSLLTPTARNIYYLDANPTELTAQDNINYIEYKETVSSNTITLNGLPNGVCDELDLVTGRYVKRVGEMTLDGTQNSSDWNLHAEYGTVTSFNYSGNSYIKMSIDNNSVLCDKFPTIIIGSMDTEGINIHDTVNGQFQLQILTSKASTIAELQTYLTANPITVKYPMLNPIILYPGDEGYPLASQPIIPNSYSNSFILLSSESLTPTFKYSLKTDNYYDVQGIDTTSTYTTYNITGNFLNQTNLTANYTGTLDRGTSKRVVVEGTNPMVIMGSKINDVPYFTGLKNFKTKQITLPDGNIGYSVVRNTGKNLLPNLGNITFTSGTNMGEVEPLFSNIKLKPNTTYTFSGSYTQDVGANAYFICLNSENKTFISHNEAFANTSIENRFAVIDWKTFTTDSINIYATITANSGILTADAIYSNIQLEEGSVATEYEPYFENEVYIDEELELRSLPDGTCDELDLNTGILTRKVGKYTLNGSENWNEYGIYTDLDDISAVCTINNLNNKYESTLAFISQFISKSWSDHVKKYDAPYIWNHDPNKIGIKLERTIATNEKDIKKFLNRNNIVFQYALDIPTKTQLSLKTKGNYKHILMDGINNTFTGNYANQGTFNNFACYYVAPNDKTSTLITKNIQTFFTDRYRFLYDGYSNDTCESSSQYDYAIYIRINRNKLNGVDSGSDTTYGNQYLQNNNFNLYYRANTIGLTDINKSVYISGGHLIQSSDVACSIKYSLPNDNYYYLRDLKPDTRYSFKNARSITINGTVLENLTSYTTPSSITNYYALINGSIYSSYRALPAMYEGNPNVKYVTNYLEDVCYNVGDSVISNYNEDETVSNIISPVLTDKLHLRSLPDGTCDTFNAKTGIITRRVGVFNTGSSISTKYECSINTNTISLIFKIDNCKSLNGDNNFWCDNFDLNVENYDAYQSEFESLSFGNGTGFCQIVLNKSHFLEYTREAFISYLNNNPFNIYYALNIPIYETISLTSTNEESSLFINGHTILTNNGICPSIDYSIKTKNYYLPYLTQGDTYTFTTPSKHVEINGEIFDNPNTDDIPEIVIDSKITSNIISDDTYKDRVQNGELKEAKLEGKTLVNLCTIINASTSGAANNFETLTNSHKITVTTGGSQVIVYNLNQTLKPNTKYIVFTKLLNRSITEDCNIKISFHSITTDLYSADIVLMNEDLNYTFIETTDDASNYDKLIIGVHSIMEVDNSFEVTFPILLEYQEGMENWDISYFEKMKNVEFNSVKIFKQKELLNEPYKENITSLMPKLTKDMFEQGAYAQWSSDKTFEEFKNVAVNSYTNKRIRCKELIPVVPGVKLIISSSSYNLGIGTFNKNKLSLRDYGWQLLAENNILIIPKDVYYIGIAIRNYYDNDLVTITNQADLLINDFNPDLIDIKQVLPMRGLPSGIKDELDLVNGKYIKHIEELTFDGSDDEEWTLETLNDSNSNQITRFKINGPGNVATTTVNNICINNWGYINSWEDDANKDYLKMTYGNIYIYQKNTNMTIDEFKNILRNKSFIIQYQLNTPIEYDISLSYTGVPTSADKPYIFKDGHIMLSSNTGILPKLSYKLNEYQTNKFIANGNDVIYSDNIITVAKGDLEYLPMVKEMENVENTILYRDIIIKDKTTDTIEKVILNTNGFELRSLPNGVKDEIDLINQVYIQRVGETVLDGNSNIVIPENTIFIQKQHRLCNIEKDAFPNIKSNSILNSDKFINCYWGNDKLSIHYSTNIDMNIPIKFTTDESVKAWLNELRPTVQYELNTPVITPLSEIPELSELVIDRETQAFVIQLNMVIGNHSDSDILPYISYKYRTNNSYSSKLFKPSTIYTVHIPDNKELHLRMAFNNDIYNIYHNSTFTTPDKEIPLNTTILLSENCNIIITEKDTTNIVFNSYFENIRSTFDNVNGIISITNSNELGKSNISIINNISEEGLLSLPSGIKDEIIINRQENKVKFIKRVKKLIFDGSDDESFILQDDAICMMIKDMKIKGTNNRDIYCDSFNACSGYLNNKSIFIGFKELDSSLHNIFNFKQYLKNNPVTVYYELEEPVITELSIIEYPIIYNNGTTEFNSDTINPISTIKYSLNQQHQIQADNEFLIRHQKEISYLYRLIAEYINVDYEASLLSLNLKL